MASSAFARDHHAEILSALKHLELAQAQTRGVYEPGQWPTDVTSILLPSLAGVGRWGKPYPEPTIFTTASIVIVLRQILAEAPRYRKWIEPMIQKAVKGYSPYSMPPFFNFYPLRQRKGVWVRGPRNFYLAPYFRGLANVPPDADTTSVTYLSLAGPVPAPVFAAFSRFRDVDREPHFYNHDLGVTNTGAFLTWLMDEKDPNMPRKLGHPELGPRIPFGTNDVDCIVNANVLNLMAARGNSSMKGFAESCELLQTAIDKGHYGVCGIYYPSDYLLPLRAAELSELGGRCLQSHHHRLLQYVLETQHPQQGSWTNAPPSRPDLVQSTALAVTTLMMLGDRNNPDHRARVQKGIQFLLNQRRQDRQGNIYWKGQVFFSAVAQARYSVVWRSSSYTTILVARALQLAENF